jgi:hypothetical protein
MSRSDRDLKDKVVVVTGAGEQEFFVVVAGDHLLLIRMI